MSHPRLRARHAVRLKVSCAIRTLAQAAPLL